MPWSLSSTVAPSDSTAHQPEVQLVTLRTADTPEVKAVTLTLDADTAEAGDALSGSFTRTKSACLPLCLDNRDEAQLQCPQVVLPHRKFPHFTRSRN